MKILVVGFVSNRVSTASPALTALEKIRQLVSNKLDPIIPEAEIFTHIQYGKLCMMTMMPVNIQINLLQPDAVLFVTEDAAVNIKPSSKSGVRSTPSISSVQVARFSPVTEEPVVEGGVVYYRPTLQCRMLMSMQSAGIEEAAFCDVENKSFYSCINNRSTKGKHCGWIRLPLEVDSMEQISVKAILAGIIGIATFAKSGKRRSLPLGKFKTFCDSLNRDDSFHLLEWHSFFCAVGLVKPKCKIEAEKLDTRNFPFKDEKNNVDVESSNKDSEPEDVESSNTDSGPEDVEFSNTDSGPENVKSSNTDSQPEDVESSNIDLGSEDIESSNTDSKLEDDESSNTDSQTKVTSGDLPLSTDLGDIIGSNKDKKILNDVDCTSCSETENETLVCSDDDDYTDESSSACFDEKTLDGENIGDETQRRRFVVGDGEVPDLMRHEDEHIKLRHIEINKSISRPRQMRNLRSIKDKIKFFEHKTTSSQRCSLVHHAS